MPVRTGGGLTVDDDMPCGETGCYCRCQSGCGHACGCDCPHDEDCDCEDCLQDGGEW